MPPSKWIAESSAPLPLETVAQDAVRTRLEGVLNLLPRAAFLWQEDVEHVHGLRVATRRAVATLELFQPLFPVRKTRRLLKILKQVRKSADVARDLDVFLCRLGEPTEEGGSLLRARLHKMRHRAQLPVVDTAVPLLRKNVFASRVERLVGKTSPPDAPVLFGEWSARRLGEGWKRFVDHLPPAGSTPDELHEFRLAGKRLRYSIEVLGGGLPDPVRKKLYPQIVKLQEKLGAIQDHAVAADRLSEWQSVSRCPAEKRYLAALEAEERMHFAHHAEAFREWWHPEYITRLSQIVDDACDGLAERAD